MAQQYVLHPSIGVARLGNSETDFYLEPYAIGSLPVACDAHGNEQTEGGKPKLVKQFKDAQGRIKRQASKFRIFRSDNAPGTAETEVTLESPEIAAIEWTVHLANKKAAWYNFSMLQGNTMYSTGQFDNSYQARNVPLRNAGKTTPAQRQKLIIDPGPRTITGPNNSVAISEETIPADYPFGSFPDQTKFGYDITTLGDLKTDAAGRLLVLGGLGKAGGDQPITSFAGADTWHDDISDGTVACKLTLKDGSVEYLTAWVIIGSPRFAPEIDNICTLSDTMLDVAVRFQQSMPGMYDPKQWAASGGWNPDFEVNYYRDVEPILVRPKKYQWVANIQPMMAFTLAHFNFSDPSEGNAKNRARYFSYFRRPDFYKGDHQQLFSDNGIPLMPMNSGSNSVSNVLIEKFLSLTHTQYYFLEQWAKGKFNLGNEMEYPHISTKDQVGVGNCVGLPMCPGIEVTWNLQNPALYAAPYRIKHRHDGQYYPKNGLDPQEDETDGGGCEPGDLTKRMAIPWQADFFDCTVQYVNFTDPNVNKEVVGGVMQPAPPTYYAYWWPPQSPWDVISGVLTEAEQQVANIPAGVQVNYARGINNFSQMIQAWSYLGFVVNQNDGEDREMFPYFVETERNHDKFTATSIPVSSVSHNDDDQLEIPVFYLKEEHKEMIHLAIRAAEFTPILTSHSSNVPRSGSRIRF